MPEVSKRITTMECGCIVTTVNHNIVDWKANCPAHKAAWDNTISSHDQLIEDMIFGNATKT